MQVRFGAVYVIKPENINLTYVSDSAENSAAKHNMSHQIAIALHNVLHGDKEYAWGGMNKVSQLQDDFAHIDPDFGRDRQDLTKQGGMITDHFPVVDDDSMRLFLTGKDASDYPEVNKEAINRYPQLIINARYSNNGGYQIEKVSSLDTTA